MFSVKRAKASCCGNSTSCITYRHDIGWDVAFAVLFGVYLILMFGLGFGGLTQIVPCIIMISLFNATAALSCAVSLAARVGQQESMPSVADRVRTAAPKSVQIVWEDASQQTICA
jgi:hypothetical protein